MNHSTKRRAAHGPPVPPITQDPVVAAYLPGVDRTLLLENLKLTLAQRLEKLARFARFTAALRDAGAKARRPKA